MKITSTLEFIDKVTLRKLVVWVCGRLDLPVRKVPIVNFAKSRRSFGGLYQYKGVVGCRIGSADHFPCNDSRDGKENFALADQIEALIYLAAHELEHRKQHLDGRLRRLGRDLERITRGTGRRVLLEFRLVREQLLSKPAPALESEEKPQAAKPTIVEKRAAKVAAKLKEWEAKQKRAAAKVKEYRLKARYYAKKLSAAEGK